MKIIIYLKDYSKTMQWVCYEVIHSDLQLNEIGKVLRSSWKDGYSFTNHRKSDALKRNSKTCIADLKNIRAEVIKSQRFPENQSIHT